VIGRSLVRVELPLEQYYVSRRACMLRGVSPVSAKLASRRRDHIFYTGTAVLAACLVFAGFARTFYLRSATFRPLAPPLLVHGVLFSSWFVLLVAQVSLVAALMVVVGIVTTLYATRLAAPNAGADALAFMTTPLFDILLFALLSGAGLAYRRQPETHKRLMLLATIAIFPPAIARLPFAFIAEGGPWEVFAVADAILVACVAYDTIVRRRLNPVFACGALVIIVSQPLRIAIGGSHAWQTFAASLVR
jgi:hypothetical protein